MSEWSEDRPTQRMFAIHANIAGGINHNHIEADDHFQALRLYCEKIKVPEIDLKYQTLEVKVEELGEFNKWEIRNGNNGQ